MKSPCLWALFQPLSRVLVIFAKQGKFIKYQYEMLKLSTSLRVIIVVVQVGAVKIYVAAE
jgi:hypothetical protein